MYPGWQGFHVNAHCLAPLSLIISAFAPVTDLRKSCTPQLRVDSGPSSLLLLDLGRGKHRLGGSALAQVFRQLNSEVPDLDNADDLKNLFGFIQDCHKDELCLAYHDRSDGGLFTTIAEMCFAGHCGVDIQLAGLAGEDSLLAGLFAEEIGVVVQVNDERLEAISRLAGEYELQDCLHVIGKPNQTDELKVSLGGNLVFARSRVELQRTWSETSYHMQSIRDNSDCAKEEFDQILQADDPGMNVVLGFDLDEDITAPYVNRNAQPKVAVLREQGVNGQIEMAAAFDRARFDAIDIHMTDIIEERVKLDDFNVVVACGGFSYGDVLGAGGGWAKSILFNEKVRSAFISFFENPNTLSLGVCNGCQMVSLLHDLIPGADHWPNFVRNRSEQFEGRLSLVKVESSPSVFLKGIAGSQFPLAVAHGEGRALFANDAAQQALKDAGLVSIRYVDNSGDVAQKYPANPNGSPEGIAGLCSKDGRVTIMMPHPERVFRASQNSWHPDDWNEDAPSMRMFRNARSWLD